MAIEVVRDRAQKMKHVVHVRQHALAVDEPEANGGEDLGPTPHEVYDSALGACKALTLVWYARRKQIPLEDVQVSVERDDSQERAGLYRLQVRLTLGGPLTDAARGTAARGRQVPRAQADDPGPHRSQHHAGLSLAGRAAAHGTPDSGPSGPAGRRCGALRRGGAAAADGPG